MNVLRPEMQHFPSQKVGNESRQAGGLRQIFQRLSVTRSKISEFYPVPNSAFMIAKTTFERVAFTPAEFAKLFGKSQTWGYRQIYGGKVKAITEHGRILIPAAEVDAVLKSAGVYDGLKTKTAKSKAEIQKLAPRLQNAWQSFLAARRRSPAKTKKLGVSDAPKAKWPALPSGRQAALARLTRKPKSREKAR